MPLAVRRYSIVDLHVGSPKSPISPRTIEELLESTTEAREGPESQQRRPASHPAGPTRLLPTSAGDLYAGSNFVGKQTNKEQSYDVKVEFKHVDLTDSFVCGYLHIKNLTAFCPILTTYFEGEIIGGPNKKHSFLTRKWNTNAEIDRQHWGKFPSFKPYADTFNSEHFEYDPFGKDEGFLFMRWKEMFLVPDHRVGGVLGASFAGFYYVCFDLRKQSISGLYYHEDSELFQSLELKYVPERTSGSFEFR